MLTIFQTAVGLITQDHQDLESILVKHFNFLWLLLDKEMDQFLAQ